MTKPSILISVLNLCERSGSPLHVLELAKAFQKKGWKVTVFTCVAGFPILQDFVKDNIEVIEFKDSASLNQKYDVFFAFHRRTSEYLYSLGLSFKKIIVSSLGPTSPDEELPFFANEANLLVFNSQETAAARKGNLKVPLFIFENYATNDYFEYSRTDIKENLKKIAVISNHLTKQAKGLQDLAKKENITIDYFGIETQSVNVTPSFLNEYDCIVTIGRTVQFCFATKTPVYVYDWSGDAGYISKINFNQNRKYNFSGRPNRSDTTTKELFNNIKNGYPNAIKNVDFLYNEAIKFFNFDNTFNKMLNIIDTTEENPAIKPCGKDYNEKIMEHVRESTTHYLQTAELNFTKVYASLQIFWGSTPQSAASEENSQRFWAAHNATMTLIPSTLIPKDAYLLRIDPDDKPCICKTSRNLIPFNAISKEHNYDIFNTVDPIYIFDQNTTESSAVEIEIKEDDDLILLAQSKHDAKATEKKRHNNKPSYKFKQFIKYKIRHRK